MRLGSLPKNAPATGKTIDPVPRGIKGTRNITGKPFRKLFFGTGNWCYPRSRVSLGIWVLEEWAKKNHITWDLEWPMRCAVAENERALLVKPLSYDVERNGESWLKGTSELKMPFDRCVVVHSDERRDFGDIELTFGGRTEYNPGLRSILDIAGTQAFARIAVGVKHPENKHVQLRHLPVWEWGEHHHTEWFLLNKFPEFEQQLIQHILMPEIFNMMDFANSVTDRNDYEKRVIKTYEEVVEEYKQKIETMKGLPQVE